MVLGALQTIPTKLKPFGGRGMGPSHDGPKEAKMTSKRLALAAALLPFVLAAAGCGGGTQPAAPTRTSASPATAAEGAEQGSKGQVAAPAAAARVSFYAAARFAEQASFGPTPALIAELQAKGFERWIDEQFALQASQIDIAPYGFVDPTPQADWDRFHGEFPTLAVRAPDQLRLRVMWSLGQFIVVSHRKGDLHGALHWMNNLQRWSLGSYSDLLYGISVDPMMGQYLDNLQNRPKSAECPHCAPNENYARELMQLFSLGVYKLNPDGSAQRDNRGRLIETYTQKDVEELARVLTGWAINNDPPNRPVRNWANWAKPLVPSTWPPERDSGQKVVLGKTFPAGQSTDKDLRDAVALLMAHPNTAPFVAQRMIQHLVKSDPTPAYVGRVAAAFRDNGRGQAGDMKAVVKAVLLDREARVGDDPATASIPSGKFREPVLHSAALWRGLGCQRYPRNNWGGIAITGSQNPFGAESVFGYYAPTDRAPGSNLLAPEQRLLTPIEIRDRIALPEWPGQYRPNQLRDWSAFNDSGCQLAELSAAFKSSPREFLDLLSRRYFRGAMPPTLRSNIEQMMREPWPPWNRDDPYEGALRMLGYALATPYFGVIK